MSIFNDEIRGEKAPEAVQDFVTRFGGRNIYGLPNYRMVAADAVHHKAYGEFYDWPEEASLQQRNGLELSEEGKWEKTRTSPLRTVTEMRWIPTYPDQQGWLIERWYPAHMFGSRQKWEAESLLGPYPEQGRYIECCKPIQRMPSFREIENVIQGVEHKIANKQGSLEQRTRKRALAILEAMEKDKAKKKAEMLLKMRDASKPIWGDSLAAGRLRSRVAERAGIRSHVGN